MNNNETSNVIIISTESKIEREREGLLYLRVVGGEEGEEVVEGGRRSQSSNSSESERENGMLVVQSLLFDKVLMFLLITVIPLQMNLIRSVLLESFNKFN